MLDSRTILGVAIGVVTLSAWADIALSWESRPELIEPPTASQMRESYHILCHTMPFENDETTPELCVEAIQLTSDEELMEGCHEGGLVGCMALRNFALYENLGILEMMDSGLLDSD